MASNLHACAVLLDDRGVLLCGPSGSGKTTLALTLSDLARLHGLAARLVSDDQVWLAAGQDARLIASAPSPIAGLVELRGFGPAPIISAPRMVVDLVVRLVEPGTAPRMAEAGREALAGCRVPSLSLPRHSAAASARAVLAALGLGPFSG